MEQTLKSPEKYEPGDDVVIWRFIRFNSFIELVSGNFTQTRVDSFDDELEGAFGWREMALAESALNQIGLPPDFPKVAALRQARLHALATCWFEYPGHELYSMWQLYGRRGDSVAIETDVGCLKRTLAKAAGGVRVERMRYFPLKGSVTNIQDLFFHKRPEFQDEREIRSIQVLPVPAGSRVHNQALLLSELNDLIKRIVVAPGRRPLLLGSVTSVVTAIFNIARLRFAGQIVPSELDADVLPIS